MDNKTIIYTEKDYRSLKILQILSQEQIRNLMRKSTITRYHPKDIIFRQGLRTSHIMYVKSGLVKIYKEQHPDITVLLKFISSEQFLGLSTHFGSNDYNYSASAITESEIICIDTAFFYELLEDTFEFNKTILNTICQENLYIFDKYLRQTYKHLPGRVADVILYFSEEIYKSESFLFPVSRKELAEFAATTTESFVRTLTEFRNDKIIDLNGTSITIKSLELIKALSENG